MLKMRIRKALQRFVFGDEIPTARVEYVHLDLRDGDLLIFPSSVSDGDFRAITSMIDTGKRVAVVTADNVSVVRLS